MYWSLHWVSSVGGVDMLNFNSALFLEAIYHGNLKLGTMVVCDEGFPKMYIF